MLRDVREVIRGGDFMKFTMRLERAGSVAFNVQSQVPVYDDGPFPSR
ncbi:MULTISPECIES: hypothetical protein [Streptomyces]|uniref:Uncharacterized protein n=1 Tax=Streptomyces fimbriatus TaxID=68197 RepID=A0ABW0DM97_STRFI